MHKIFKENSLNPTIRMHESGESPDYWYFHKADYPSQPPLLYKRLLDNALSKIEVWDPHFNATSDNYEDAKIFMDVNNDITIKILTWRGINPTYPYLPGVENAMKNVIPTAKNVRFGMRVINKSEPANEGGCFFHDRFLIIDDQDIYLIGASVGYHLVSVRSTGIFKVTNADTVQFIKSLFNYYWNESYKKQIPIKFLHT